MKNVLISYMNQLKNINMTRIQLRASTLPYTPFLVINPQIISDLPTTQCFYGQTKSQVSHHMSRITFTHKSNTFINLY